ncbi:LysR family transcriptional regulator [Comamonas testosteroni]|jgi:LysR family transcriptional regulator of beta-lactamase|uniref:Transcriptional regulator, LysR family n=2 Tax=Comamonas testosteroni TaxID=285 RepID=B7WWP3_COMTK|nr:MULTISPECIES: LysR family transcriptional regulator [Comamonas]AIJ46624.1 LysR family transcriptional regulator [Comamonas testosteroni TK102]EED67777.1 transcriptional regulator, LysR family [Comamonas testosteroni KF-1]MPS89744.1 LysR family transcriptional regulator [Comamonas sp.]TYK69732.1 LysR family transcriptional regulator [Comamonas sp. Z3]WQG65907.1 LysR family transcriptional regulator [Comamonas testosteroni]
MQLPLNALRMFDAAARHLSLTRAAQELHVTQAAVSQHIRNLEERLGKPLFRRLPRGLALTDEGQALWPVVAQSFERIEQSLQQVAEPRPREILSVGVVGTFAIGWLIPRLSQFQQLHPYIDLRLLTNNNRVDLAGEGLDAAVRFGDGAWHGTHAQMLLRAPLSPMCTPMLAQQLREPADLARQTLLRSYRTQEWEGWFAGLDQTAPLARGAMFDSSLTLAEAAAQGAGIALLPARMFEHMLQQGRLVRPFAHEVDTGAYWLTYLKSRQASSALQTFRQWLMTQLQTD